MRVEVKIPDSGTCLECPFLRSEDQLWEDGPGYIEHICARFSTRLRTTGLYGGPPLPDKQCENKEKQ